MLTRFHDDETEWNIVLGNKRYEAAANLKQRTFTDHTKVQPCSTAYRVDSASQNQTAFFASTFDTSRVVLFSTCAKMSTTWAPDIPFRLSSSHQASYRMMTPDARHHKTMDLRYKYCTIKCWSFVPIFSLLFCFAELNSATTLLPPPASVCDARELVWVCCGAVDDTRRTHRIILKFINIKKL